MKYFFIFPGLVFLLVMNACNPTALPDPARPPTPTAALAPANPPTATIPATATNTPTPTLTATATSVPNGPCDNPLVPLGQGNRWVYRVTSSNGEASFSLTSQGLQPGGNTSVLVAFSDQNHNLTITEPVKCQDGAIVDFPLFVLNMLFSPNLDKYIPAAYVSGIYAPNYQSLIQNNWVLNWQERYLTKEAVNLKDPRGLAGLSIPANTQMDVSYVLNNLHEPVVSPAGNFPQALKITQFLSLLVVGGLLYIGIGEWYEPYTGLVRAQINAVLLGNERLPIESTLELMEFTPAN